MTISPKVSDLYMSILFRNPDQKGGDFWTEELAKGTSLDTVRDAILSSKEVGDHVSPVIRLYEAAFGRAPDQPGLTFWVNAEREGVSLQEIAQGFTGSAEFDTRYGSSVSREDFIETLYTNVLGRSSDAEGKAFWSATTLSNAELLTEFATSAEFVTRSEEPIKQYLTLTAAGEKPVGSLFALGTTLVSGSVIDGKVAGATVFIDLNDNGVQDAGEASTTTDASGNFEFPAGTQQGGIVATGGTDISTGLAFTAKMSAPAGSKVVTPVTTLIKKLADLDTSSDKTPAQKAADAQTQLKALLGLSDITADLTTVDFVRESIAGDATGEGGGISDSEAAKVYSKAIKIINFVKSTSSAISGSKADASISEEDASDAAFDALVTQFVVQRDAGTTGVDLLNNAGTLAVAAREAATAKLGNDAAANAKADAIADALGTVIAAGNTSIDAAISGLGAGSSSEDNLNALIQVVKVGKAVQGGVSDGFKAAAQSDNPQAGAATVQTQSTSDNGFSDDLVNAQDVGDVDGDGAVDDIPPPEVPEEPDLPVLPNTPATIGGDATGEVTEDTDVDDNDLITVSGTLTVSDPNAGQGAFRSQTDTTGDYGSFTLGMGGAWTYTADNSADAIQELDTGDTLTDTFNAVTADGTTKSVTVTINGVTEADVIVTATESLQNAINDAEVGAIIELSAGTYALTETLNISKGITLRGSSEAGDVIIDASTLTGSAIAIGSDATGAVTITNIDLTNTGVATRGIDLEAADLDSFTYEDGTISGFTQQGIWGTDGFAEDGAEPVAGAFLLKDATLSDNGTTANPTADLKLFGFSGAITIQNVSFDNTAQKNKAIEIIGGLTSDSNANTFSDNSDAVLPAANVTITDVKVKGDYARGPVSLQNYETLGADSSGVSITNLDLSGATTTWAYFNIDTVRHGVIDGPAIAGGITLPTGRHGEKVFELQGGQPAQDAGSLTITGIDVSEAGDEAYVFLRGGNGDDTITAGGGTAVMLGGAGNDTFVLSASGSVRIVDFTAGDDTIDFGGSDPETFTYILQNTAAGLTTESRNLIDVAKNADNLIVTDGDLDLSTDTSLTSDLNVELARDGAADQQQFVAPDVNDITVNVTGSDHNDIISANGFYQGGETGDNSGPGGSSNAPTLIADSGAGNDILIGGLGDNELVGGGGYDFLSTKAGGQNNVLFGGERTEQDAGVYAESVSTITDDDLLNLDANRYFNPSVKESVKQANVFQGGAANDTMVASDVTDVFYYQIGSEHSVDTIHQFEVGVDFISAVVRSSDSSTSYDDFLFIDGGATGGLEGPLSTGSTIQVDPKAAGWIYNADTAQLSVTAAALNEFFNENAEGVSNAHDITINLVGLQGVDDNTDVNDFFFAKA